MDSITQATLGAACGELVLGRRIGSRGILWGALLGTLPDLDVVVYPWLDGVDRLLWHRGISHSLLLSVAAAPVFGWLVGRAHRGRVPLPLATWFALLAFTTHVLIDCFTVYGTQVLEPFASTRVAWNNLFIIDPAFTLPMLGALVVAPWLERAAPARIRLVAVGVAVSAVYVLWSLAAKAIVDRRFEREIAARGLPAQRWMSAPMPMTTLYWRCVVDAGEALWIAHVSVFDREAPLAWRRVARGERLVDDLRGTRALEAVRWFSGGYWVARLDGGQVVLSDVRFGDVHVGRSPPPGAGPGWVFDFEPVDGGRDLRMRRTEWGDVGSALAHVARRAVGLRE